MAASGFPTSDMGESLDTEATVGEIPRTQSPAKGPNIRQVISALIVAVVPDMDYAIGIRPHREDAVQDVLQAVVAVKELRRELVDLLNGLPVVHERSRKNSDPPIRVHVVAFIRSPEKRDTGDLSEVDQAGVLPRTQEIVPQINVSSGADPVPVTVVEAGSHWCRSHVVQQTRSLVSPVYIPAQALHVVLQCGVTITDNVDPAVRVAEHQVVVDQLNGPRKVASDLRVDGGIGQRDAVPVVDVLYTVHALADALLFDHEARSILLTETGDAVLTVTGEVVERHGPVRFVHSEAVVAVPEERVRLLRTASEDDTDVLATAVYRRIGTVQDRVQSVSIGL